MRSCLGLLQKRGGFTEQPRAQIQARSLCVQLLNNGFVGLIRAGRELPNTSDAVDYEPVPDVNHNVGTV